ncbi:MAG: hypothetical protein LBR71_06685 [Synergistaceae bacterium]|jgi:hypothetical protein|nr:hypothetical protein [Synergistaceae bacterium]
MTGNYYVFQAWQGETFSRLLTWRLPDGAPVDISAMTARLQLRIAPSDTISPALDMTEDNGMILNGGAEGTLRLSIPAAALSALEPIVYVYDLELTSAVGNVERLLWGKFWVRPEVTRDDVPQ